MTSDETTGKTIGQSFRGRSLEGADFSSKDLRGADFTGADLRSADFTDATLGVAPRIGAVILGIAMLVSIAAGVAIGWVVGEIREQVYADEWDQAASGGSMVFLLLAFVAVVIWRGFDLAIKVAVVLYVVGLAGNIIVNLLWNEIEWYRAPRDAALLVVLFLAILAGIMGRVIGGVFGAWSISVVAIVGGLATGQAQGGIAGIVVAISLVIISKRAVRGDPRDRLLRRLAHRLVGRWGTTFADADLTGADFTGTDASKCNASGATCNNTNWNPEHPLPVDLPE